jgi:hypothetical protein
MGLSMAVSFVNCRVGVGFFCGVAEAPRILFHSTALKLVRKISLHQILLYNCTSRDRINKTNSFFDGLRTVHCTDFCAWHSAWHPASMTTGFMLNKANKLSQFRV